MVGRNVGEQSGFAPKAFQRLDRGDFRQVAARRRALEPGKKARHRHAVAQLRRTRALDLDRVLHRLHRRDRVGAAHHRAAILGDEPRDRLGAGGRIEPHGAVLLTERGQVALERGVRPNVGDVFQLRADFVADLAQVHKDRRPAVLRHGRECEHHWRMRYVAAADVEQPRHRMRVGDHQRVGSILRKLGAHALEFAGRLFAGIAHVVRDHRAERRLGPVGPNRIDRIVVDRDKRSARFAAGFGKTLGAVDGVKPGRIAELRSGRHIGLDPGRRRISTRCSMVNTAPSTSSRTCT